MVYVDFALIGRKVFLEWHGRRILATVERVDYGYPRTAYGVIWTEADNPDEYFDRCSAYRTTAHASQIMGVAT